MLKRMTEAEWARGADPAERPEGAGLMPLEVRGLTLEVAGKTLIDGIDLSIVAGGMTIILGANGAGKTLLLRLLHGLIEPTGGTIRWGIADDATTRTTANGDAARLRQAMVFQRPVLLRRSVAANIDFALGLRGRASAEKRDALLDHVGLLERARQPARLLSGGEQQRLALARALANKPQLVLADEPTGSLDARHAGEALALTRELCDEQGAALLLVSHDPQVLGAFDERLDLSELNRASAGVQS